MTARDSFEPNSVSRGDSSIYLGDASTLAGSVHDWLEALASLGTHAIPHLGTVPYLTLCPLQQIDHGHE